MSDIRVDGYVSLSFWREEEIGIIVLRTDENAELSLNHLSELITALGTAAMDDKVRAVAITGMNMRFAGDLKIDSRADAKTLEQYSQTLLSLVYSIEKPIFTILNGDAIGAGYEIALLGDVILASGDVSLGLGGSYTFKLGGSVTSIRFNNFDIRKASVGVNADVIFNKDRLLDDAKQYIKDHILFDYPLIRKRRMISLRESLLEERERLNQRMIF
ncbi:MAG: enoyl-CoA hydratase-related protein [Thermoplasmataceae archaeon]